MVYESCWESAARRFWCWRGTTRLIARLCHRFSPAQMSVWGRAKGRQETQSLQTIIQNCPTHPTILHYRVVMTSQALTAQPGCPSEMWKLSNTGIRLLFHLSIIMASSLEKSNDQIDWFSHMKTIICGMTYWQIVNDYFMWAWDFVKGMSQCAILMKKLVSFCLLCL